MKKLLIIYSSAIILFASCSKVLDIPNLNGYDPSLVWTDPNVANAYLGNIYSDAFGNWNIGLDGQSEQLTGVPFPADVVTTVNAGNLVAIPGSGNNDWNNNYTRIRLINEGILRTNIGTLPQNVKDALLGQFYFLRAYTYFGLVKTYGGVPYLKVPQDRYADELNIPRNSTKDCFDFINNDLDSAIGLLPQRITSSSGDWGRIDGNFALAFKAKVSLYKASPQFNPGNPWNNSYWSEAYTINKKAYDSLSTQGYTLIEDYAQIALSERNAEVVFSVTNLFPNKVAAWDNGARPGSLSRGPASVGPTWEMVKAFPMKDGKQYDDPSGLYYKSDAEFLQSYWLNRDPRFEKSVVWNAGLYPVAGTMPGYRQYTSIGIANVLDSYGVNPKSSEKSQNNDRYSGFFILKNSNLSLTQAQVQQYDVDYVLMRFAEVMLNYAEAANETGHTSEALDILKAIRQRAGIEAGASGSYGIIATTREQTRQAIMDERNIEFCFEGLRFSDLRRWRMFSVFNAKPKNGVEAIAINAGGAEIPLTQAREMALANQLTETNFKYSLLQTPQSGVDINTLPNKYYFAPIQQNVIAAGSKIEQNKDWGGTFNPTLE
ncbi:RagB/SusD family nutrient uptake outer membrane protein [Niabella ginsengisoli]|uniref:RagB/SusD family nutrient uptake outer membrane protein n=1 Tax=Niabella ginsengisoli TaxID=522298 RepID=A0ABS9SLZ7_9BACT|nr:RagB/SusD family nutrient uptake outer membrane protein [Niabella ginsengisoli]MCH5599350.1 RagB/SusD family nutrient uptake outer membrane protein [Niabella ginsengisoli]